MRYIKKFELFESSNLSLISEELVTGIKPSDMNIFSSLFNSDPLKLKEFIQSNFELQNLKFISGGAIGLAFFWQDKVIKFTTDLSEKRGVERLLELAPGNSYLPGFAKYFWMKEVQLPESLWKKSYKDITQDELELINKQRDLRKSGRKINLLSGELGLKRKSEQKNKLAYIICMEKLRMLNEFESEIAHFIFLVTKAGYLKPEQDNSTKLKKLIDWIKSDEEVYSDDGFNQTTPIFSTREPGLTKAGFFSNDEETIKKYKGLWNKITDKNFIDFGLKMLNLYKMGGKLGIPTSDIHENNIGYRGDELVAFDCM